jgi:toxin-antitoxin system PIN domain toxin
MLLDANLLLYAVHKGAPQHERTATWLTEQLNGPKRVGLPWQSLAAFLRISTHPRAFQHPLAPHTAWELVTDWLAAPVAWIPQPGPEHARILGKLITTYEIRGNLVPDAQLAALAIEHGVPLCSNDTDFARFRELRWVDPLESADQQARDSAGDI